MRADPRSLLAPERRMAARHGGDLLGPSQRRRGDAAQARFEEDLAQEMSANGNDGNDDDFDDDDEWDGL